MKIGERFFDTAHRTYIMGIINVTPDSFSEGSRCADVSMALKRAEEMIAEGADLLDIGGESTRPGFSPVSCQLETERTAPVIEAIHARFEIPISVDTTKPAVASEAIRCGAAMVNDISGFKGDPGMAPLCAERGVSVCLMHNRAERLPYRDLVGEVRSELGESLSIALDAGIEKERILLDPGIGFAKDLSENLTLTANLEKLKIEDYPFLLGASRKSLIGKTLSLPPAECLEGTLVTTAAAVLAGYAFVRVHDVKENARVIAMTRVLREHRLP